MELWANANKALEDLLTTKVSIDTHRQRDIWELCIELCWNESQAAESIKEAKAVCSWATLDAQTTCSWLTLDAKTNCSRVILEAKTACSAVVKEVKTTRGHIIEEAKATCSSSIRDVEAQRASQAETLQREHGNIMWLWRCKSFERRVEAKLTSSLPARPLCTPVHQSSGVLWLLPTTSYCTDTSISPIHPITKDFPNGRTACSGCSSPTRVQAIS